MAQRATPCAWREGAKEKPLWGFRFINVVQLAMAWWAYRERFIQLRDLRCWFGCHELDIRRQHLGPDRKPRLTIAELARITGGGEASVRASVRRLTRVGLLTWPRGDVATAVRFAHSPEQLRVGQREQPKVGLGEQLAETEPSAGVVPPGVEPLAGAAPLDGFWHMLEGIPNNRRKVPVPRQVLLLMAGGATRAVIATLLGQMLCGLFYRRRNGSGECWPVGACKVSWIAETFGVGMSSVKHARQHLVKLGLLVARETHQLAMNRHGFFYELNLDWKRPDRAVVDNSTVEGRSSQQVSNESTPLLAANRPESTPPRENRELSSRVQPPETSLRHPGFAPTGSSTKKRACSGAPDRRNILPEDLHDTGRLLELFPQFARAGFVDERSENDLNAIVAAAEHARTIGSRNPCGLFAAIVRSFPNRGTPPEELPVRDRLWSYVTQSDEHAARERLKHHLGEVRPPRVEPKLKQRPRKLSADAELVRLLRANLRRARHTGDAFELLQRERPEWTRTRWDQAVAELSGVQARTAPKEPDSFADLVSAAVGEGALPVLQA